MPDTVARPAEHPVTVILCGGRGTRAYPLTEELPKPLLPVDGIPIVEHLMGVFSRRGHRSFVLATGYMGGRIAEHFAGRDDLGDIQLVETGDDTPTGERLRRCLHLTGGTFFATYADGLADVDLDGLLAFHRRHGAGATVTTVPLPSQYGTLDIDGDGVVRGFREKPRLQDHWINAGFFVFEPRVFSEYNGLDLERDILPAVAAGGELRAHRHTGYWRSLDTLKDLLEVDAVAREGPRPPWW